MAHDWQLTTHNDVPAFRCSICETLWLENAEHPKATCLEVLANKTARSPLFLRARKC